MGLKKFSWWAAYHRLIKKLRLISRPPANFFETPEDAYVSESARDFFKQASIYF